MSETIEKTGTLTKQIFYKQESSFLIGSFTNHETKETFSAVGNIVNPQTGMEYKLTGRMENNGNYGDQLKFTMFESVVPLDTNGIYKYIVRICKFVGPTVGNALVDAYGEKTLQIMKEDPEQISKVKGITFQRALEIQETLIQNEATEKIMVELESLLNIPGLRKNLPGELINKFKSNAAEVVKENPYILTSFNGISFILADRVALDIKYPADHLNRKKAVCVHVVREIMSAGNVWVPSNILLNKAQELVSIIGLENGIEELKKDNILISKHSCARGVSLLAFSKEAEKESYIAQKISRMASGGLEC